MGSSLHGPGLTKGQLKESHIAGASTQEFNLYPDLVHGEHIITISDNAMKLICKTVKGNIFPTASCGFKGNLLKCNSGCRLLYTYQPQLLR